MFDVPDLLVVHMLLLTPKFDVPYDLFCLPDSWFLGVLDPVLLLYLPKTQIKMMIPPFYLMRSVDLPDISIYCFYSVLQCPSKAMPFFPLFSRFFQGAFVLGSSLLTVRAFSVLFFLLSLFAFV